MGRVKRRKRRLYENAVMSRLGGGSFGGGAYFPPNPDTGVGRWEWPADEYIPAGFDPDSDVQPWPKPTFINPTIVQIPFGYFDNTVSTWANAGSNGRPGGPRAFADDEDVVYLSYNGMRQNTSDFKSVGGRRVGIDGGYFRGRVQIIDVTDIIYIAGPHINLTGAPNKDGIGVGGKAGFIPDVYVMDYTYEGLQGTNSGFHADAFQLYGPVGQVFISGAAGDSNYQHILARAEFMVLSLDVWRFVGVFNSLGPPGPDGNTYGIFDRNEPADAPVGDPLFPITYCRVAIAANLLFPNRAAAWPPPGQATRGEPVPLDYAGVVDEKGAVRWSPAGGKRGVISKAAPNTPKPIRTSATGLNYSPKVAWQYPYLQSAVTFGSQFLQLNGSNIAMRVQ